MEFLTGRQSKLARLLENAIRDQLQVEIELFNGEVVYGTIVSYELSAKHLYITCAASKNTVVINFDYTVKIRFQTETSLKVAPQSRQ